MPFSGPDHPQHIWFRWFPVEKNVDPAALAQAQTTLLLVQGMGCPVCAMRVYDSLLRLEGVLTVEVALAPGLARVRYDPAQVSPDVFPAAVAAASDDAHHYSARILA